MGKSSYKIGVLSRHPLRVLARDKSAPFAHGLLCVSVLQLRLCVTHLNPHDARKRVLEAKAIARRVDPNEGFMLVGDLNTLSPHDRHGHAGLARTIAEGPFSGPLSKKFLSASRDAVEYAPMQVLLDAELSDVGARAAGTGGHSVPTSINADHMHFAKLRLDYCLVNAMLAENRRCARSPRAKAAILRDDVTTKLSDHFPLVVTFSAFLGEESSAL